VMCGGGGAASHRDLQAEVTAGRFRQDLFFPLAAARVYLPPLRDRRAEIPNLAHTFLHTACAQLGRPEMEIAATTLHLL
jgi:two-component system response regulator AtoC